MKWFQDSEGNISSMRIMAMISTVCGSLLVLCGAVGFFLRIPETVAVVSVGAGMTGLGEISKAWQASRGS